MSPHHFIALIEGVVREAPRLSDVLDAIYEEATRPPVSEEELRAERRAARRAELARLQRAFG